MNKYLVRPWHLLRRQKYFQQYFEECESHKRPSKLHVGCGDRPISGWCNIDVAHLTQDVQFVNALKPLPFRDSSFQYVFTEHFIEHLTLNEGESFFREAYRVLKPGGVLRTATPDLDFMHQLMEVTEGKSDGHKRYIDYTVGNFAPEQPRSPVASMNLLFYGWGHRFIYNAAFMQEILRRIGFATFRVYKSGESDLLDLRNIEQHGKSVPPEINLLETFVLEAIKP